MLNYVACIYYYSHDRATVVCTYAVLKCLQKRGKIINDVKQYNIQCGGRPKCAVVGEGGWGHSLPHQHFGALRVESTSHEEQNGENFSSIAPSSEE